MSNSYEFGLSFQTLLLHCILTDRNFIRNYREVIQPEYFNDASYQEICRQLLRSYDKHSELPDSDTLKLEFDRSDLGETLDYILEKKVSGRKSIEERAVVFARNQAVKEAVTNQLSQEYKTEDDFTAALAEINKAFTVGTQVRAGYNYRKELRDRLVSYDTPMPAMPTGMKTIDKALDGGLHFKEMGLIIGTPSGGKTTGLVHMGKMALLNGFSVIHYSLELQRRLVARRYDMSIAGMTKDELRSKKATALIRIKDRAKGELVVHDFFSATVDTIRTDLLKQADNGFNPDMVLVDYDDLLNSLLRGAKEEAQTEDNYKRMRALTFEFNCGLWTATQTNKKACDMDDDEVLTGKQAYGSMKAKIGTPDIVLSMNQTMREYKAGKVRIHTAKVREGRAKFTEAYKIDFDRMQIEAD